MLRNKLSAVLVAASFAVAPVAALAQDAMTEGEVTKIDKSAEKITIKHGPIENLDMSAMTMVFRAAEPAMLDQVKEGDQIRFAADRVRGQLTVTEIQK